MSNSIPLTQTTETFEVAIQTSGRASGSARLAFTASDDIFPVCAPSLVSEGEWPIQPHRLLDFPLLSHSVTPQDWMEWQEWFQHIGAAMPKRARFVPFDSYPLALQAAVAGQGVALGWRRTTEDMIEEGKLIRPCKDVVNRTHEISVFRGTARDLHLDTEHLLGWLSDELSEQPSYA